MAGRVIKDRNEAITAGSAAGYITVASTTGFYETARASISKTGQTTREVTITEVRSATELGIRFARDPGQGPHYGRDDVSAYGGGDGRVDMPGQFIFNPNDKPLD